MSPFKACLLLTLVAQIAFGAPSSYERLATDGDINICINPTTAKNMLLSRTVNTVNQLTVTVRYPEQLPPTAPPTITCIRVLKRGGLMGQGATATITQGGVGDVQATIVLTSGVFLRINYDIEIYSDQS